MKDNWLFATLVLIGVVSFAPVSTTIAQQTPLYGGTLIISLTGDAATLCSAISTGFNTMVAGGQVFQGLVAHDFAMRPEPELAESWEISEDGLTYTFHLVQNATWHDGEKFTSADVKFSIEEVLIPHHPFGSSNFASLDYVQAPDNYTVVLKLEYAYPGLMMFLGKHHSTIVPKHLYEGTDILNNPYNSQPVGTGPMKFAEWVKGDHVTVVRNENYWKKGKPYFDKLIYKIIPDATARLLAFEKGEIDVLSYGVPYVSAKEMMDKGIPVETRGFESFAGHTSSLVFNLRRAPVNDTRVRQAIAYCVDKEDMLEKAIFGMGVVSDSPICHQYEELYDPNIFRYQRDVDKANELLDEAGYPKGTDGIRFQLPIAIDPFYRAENLKVAEILRDELKDVGIELEIQSYETAVQRDVVWIQWDFTTAILPTGGGPDPVSKNKQLYHSENIRPGMAINAMGYNNSRVDYLIDTALAETDPEKRRELMIEFQDIIVHDLPVLDLLEGAYLSLVSEDWVGIPSGPWGYRDTMDSAWWTKGSDVSAESAWEAIEKAESKIANLKGQFYDCGAAMQKLEEAKEAYEADDWPTAFSLANEAPGLAVPPYLIYGAVIVVVVAVVATALWYRRKRKQKT